ncbi:hypothetical protein IWQ60_001696 [Tieghemiomyces parasiticus]|uniref:Myb-like domain-containing protein n=1 Tax=Tieghemiomyces parasiticus TaxID=78921 RepID=A0A9W8AIV3_9FUNG|nr:hypothetical protein IWQ60_001696 [Tieghemiomyces parasiticus]
MKNNSQENGHGTGYRSPDRSRAPVEAYTPRGPLLPQQQRQAEGRTSHCLPAFHRPERLPPIVTRNSLSHRPNRPYDAATHDYPGHPSSSPTILPPCSLALPSLGVLHPSGYTPPPLAHEYAARRRSYDEMNGTTPPFVRTNYGPPVPALPGLAGISETATTPTCGQLHPTDPQSVPTSDGRTVTTWRPDEIRLLVTCRDQMAAEFATVKRNHGLWEKISEKLRAARSDKSGIQCRHKWKNMSRMTKENDDFNRTHPPSEHRHSEFDDDIRRINLRTGAMPPSVVSYEGSNLSVSALDTPTGTTIVTAAPAETGLSVERGSSSDMEPSTSSAIPSLQVTCIEPVNQPPSLKRRRADTDPVGRPVPSLWEMTKRLTTLKSMVAAVEVRQTATEDLARTTVERLDGITKLLHEILRGRSAASQ